MNENMIPEEKIDLLEASKESAAKLSEAAGALAKTIEAIAEYVPTVWVDNSEPDIDAEKLNHIEEGIKSATEAVNSAIGSIAQLNSDLEKANSDIKKKYPLDLLVPFSEACQFDSNGECAVTFSRPLAHQYIAILVAGTLNIELRNSTNLGTTFVCPTVAGQTVWISGLIFCVY